jgi:flagellar hook-associated protein 1 FlgK
MYTARSINSIATTARGSMQVARTLTSIASRNIANAETPGYAREYVQVMPELSGIGVRNGPLQSLKAQFLERGFLAANGRHGFHASQRPHLRVAEMGANDLGTGGLSKAIDEFRGAFQNLSANPAGAAERDAVMITGRALGNAFASTRGHLENTTNLAKSDVIATVDKVNLLATEVASIDKQIRAARPGEERNTLFARRSASLQELSGLVGITVLNQKDGTVHVQTSAGRTLIEGGRADTLKVAANPPADGPLELTFVGSDGVERAPIGGSAAIGGGLGGLVTAHNDVLRPALNNLDQLAFDVAATFNTTHQAGAGLDGTTGRDFFEPIAAVQGAARTFTLAAGFQTDFIAASADPLITGDNRNALALADLMSASGVISGGQSAQTVWGTIGGSISQALYNANKGAELELGSRDQLENLLVSEIGVSTEDEMMGIMQARQQLDAGATVMREVQRMTDTIFSMVS